MHYNYKSINNHTKELISLNKSAKPKFSPFIEAMNYWTSFNLIGVGCIFLLPVNTR